jgi:hypothetical protein
MASLAQLRKQAKEMGIAPSVIRGAETSEELQAEIDNFSKPSNGSGTKKSGTRVVKKAVAKKKSGKKTAAKKSSTKTASKKSSVKSKPAAKKSAAKRSTARKTTTRKASVTDENSGRNTLDGVDFGFTDGWNARDGSAPDRIIKALKRFKGNRGKVYDYLEGDVWDFVGKKKANGEKRTKAEALEMLAYRISRTAWDFAVRTGQHNPAQERVQYGTGGTGQGIWKSKASKARARKTGSKKTATKRGAAKKNTARKTARRK